jgi:leucyl-tRNA synthetase
LWRRLGHDASLAYHPWPKWDEAKCIDDTIEMGVQVNGKTRGTITLPRECDGDTARSIAMQNVNIARHVDGKELKRFIFVPGRIINFVVK